MKARVITIAALCLISLVAPAQQKTLKDSVYRIPLVGLHFSGQIPGADMAVRFGNSMSAGLPLYYKTKNNWMFGIEWNYFFGGRVRERVMSNLYSPEGYITDANGNPGSVRINERGWDLYALFGKMFNRLGHNKNSGIMVMVGGGYMQHKIKITDVNRTLPQIHGDLVKGYDRLTGGPALEEFIGYLYLSQNRIVNCYFGFEFQQAFTNGLRGYQFDTGMSDNKPRLDLLYGFRLGWILPLYKKAPKEFYYY